MESLPDGEMGAISDSPADSVMSWAPIKRRTSTPAQSLSPRDESFVSFGEEGEEVVGNEIRENSKLRTELKGLSEQVARIAVQNEGFQKDAGILVSQVSESLSTSDGSRLNSAKLDETQQKQMGNLLNQTQHVITQCQTTNGEMKQQQWALNSEFVKLKERRAKVEKEMVPNRDIHRVIKEKVNRVRDESQSSVGALWGGGITCWF